MRLMNHDSITIMYTEQLVLSEEISTRIELFEEKSL